MTFTRRPAFASATPSPLLERLGAYLEKDQLGRIVAEARSSRRHIDLNNITLLSRALDQAAIDGRIPGAQQKIPKRILQFWDQREIPADVARCMATWKIPGFDYVVFDDEQARDFIKAEFDTRRLEAYDMCNHPAMKSDLFRLMYLYRHGGAYVDSDDAYEGANLDRLIDDGLFRLRTIWMRKIPSQPGMTAPAPEHDVIAFNNNPIFCQAGDKILLTAFERAISIIRTAGKLDTYNVLKVTGPRNLAVAVYVTALDCIVSGTEFNFCPIVGWDDMARKNESLAYQQTDRNWRHYERPPRDLHKQ